MSELTTAASGGNVEAAVDHVPDPVSVNLSPDSVRALQAAARMARRAGTLPAAHYPALSEALSVLSEAVPRRTAIVGKGDTAEDGWEPWMARPDGA